ncbi:hypothetical protein IWQ62_004614 [Dispira parvispora]|uniref:Uncharacterized protein n=1 Tax=Dispira parvispora TaxID=1520584 RepID=A0A9W8APG5_9FUNG|nr:hypothetical protein IWQ62_004614 [Dispira parvispora]
MQASLLVWRFSSYGPGTGCANVIVGHDLSEEEVRCKLYELRLTRPNDWQMCFSSFIESMKQQMEVQLEHVRNNSERFVPRTSNQPSSAFGSQAQPFAPTQHAVGGSSQVPFPQPAAPLGFPSQPNTVPQGFPTQPNPAPPPVVSQQNFPTQNPPLPTAANPPPSMAESTFYNLEINHEYTPNEWEAFQADNFTLGGIPEYPPPPEVQR